MSPLRRLGCLLWMVQVFALPASEEAASGADNCAIDPALEDRIIMDPAFHGFPDPRPIHPSEHPEHPWISPEALSQESRSFWDGYKLMTAQDGTAEWTAGSRKACIRGHRDGMRWSNNIPPSEVAQWASEYRLAFLKHDPNDDLWAPPPSGEGYQAGLKALTTYQGPEQEMLAYTSCFAGAVEASSLFTDPQMRWPVSDGLLHGLHVGSCSKDLQDKVNQQRSWAHIPPPKTDVSVVEAAPIGQTHEAKAECLALDLH